MSPVHRYTERGLANIICDEPLAARLKFEPRGRGNADDNYYLVRDSVRSQPRSNQLVFKACTVLYESAVNMACLWCWVTVSGAAELTTGFA